MVTEEMGMQRLATIAPPQVHEIW
ncbi:phenylacetate-CoA oxygenase subunit PaaJ, partial [Escherichia coli]|nr:phenylacetate-CoA oxygenase subunit PaaJ [Escherichia coli]